MNGLWFIHPLSQAALPPYLKYGNGATTSMPFHAEILADRLKPVEICFDQYPF